MTTSWGSPATHDHHTRHDYKVFHAAKPLVLKISAMQPIQNYDFVSQTFNWKKKFNKFKKLNYNKRIGKVGHTRIRI